jgi:type I restriction enzyme S subunit
MGCEWKNVRLGDSSIQIIDGDRGVNYPNQNEFFAQEFCLFLNAKNITKDGFILNDLSFIAMEKDQALRKGKLCRNDIVMTTRGTVGNIAYYSSKIPFENIRINSGMVIFRTDSAKVFPAFLYWLLRSDIVQNQISSLMTGSAQPQLPISSIKHLILPIPDINTQRMIASIISCLDDKIELNNKINANLEAQAQAIFKSWFVDFEPFHDGEFVDSELGRIPKGWITLTFADFISASSEKSNDPEIPEYSVTNTGIYPRNEKYKKKLSMTNGANKVIRKNDLVFGMSREILNWGMMKDEIGGVSSAYNVFSLKTDLANPDYIEEFMKARQDYFYDVIKPAAREGQGIDRRALLSKLIYLPPASVYDDYVAIRNSLYSLIAKSISENDALSVIRDSLLPKLMSGEVKVTLR